MQALPYFCRSCFVILMLLLLTPTRAGAQYLYLDLNGDGLNTPADVLSGSLPVTVDIYLRTDLNRNGTPTTCASGSQPLSIGSFEFILRAVGGSVAWGTLTGGGLFGNGATLTRSNATDFYAGYFDSTDQFLPPGRYRIGTLPVIPLTGTPLLTFATTTALSPVYSTSFGSRCRGGGDADYTMRLGQEWQDADGTFGTILANVSGTVFQDTNGTSSGDCVRDPGEVGVAGWPVTLSPGGPTVLTSYDGSYRFVNVLPGLYSLHLSAPSAWNQTCPSGGANRSLIVVLGQSYPNLNFGVKPANLPPALSPISNQSIAQGSVVNVPLTASDADATPLTFSLVTGPAFASVQTIGPTSGVLHLTPSSGDAGMFGLTVAASDGTFDSRRSAAIRVLASSGIASPGPPKGKLVVSLQPNPINPIGSLTFRTSRSGAIRAILYDTNGRVVRTLMNVSRAPANHYTLLIDGRDDLGRPLASGVYFFKIETVDGVQSERAVVLK